MKKTGKKNVIVKTILSILVLAILPVSVYLVQRNQETRSQAKNTTDAKCTAKGGTCTLVTTSTKEGATCNNNTGEIVFNLCSGGNNIRCCVPFDDSKCIKQGGECINGVSSSVKEGDSCQGKNITGKYKFNLCDGDKSRRCCLPIITPTSTPTPSNSNIIKISTGGDSNQLVVATFNIGNAAKTSKANYKTIGAEIKQDDFDIVGLQESHANLTLGISSKSGLSNHSYVDTTAGNAIISKITLSDPSYVRLTTCGRKEFRAIQKTILNINGKKISFYNTHVEPADISYSCRSTEAKDVYNVIKDDPNPWILVGDFNFASNCTLADTIFGDFLLVANDDLPSGHKCTDMIIISPNRGINLVSKKSIKMDGVLSDHNLVTATLAIENDATAL